MRSTRRSYLAALGGTAAIGATAGCLGGAGGTDPDLRVETLAAGGSRSETVPVRPTGRVALLDFFATWCPSCKTQMSNFRALADRFPDLHLLSITWEDDASAVRGFWNRHGGTWPVATDPQMRTGQAFDVETIPTMLLFDAEGTRVWQDTGVATVERMTAAVEHARR